MTIETSDKILEMLRHRLFAQMARGPAMVCNPWRSRQRMDLCDVARLGVVDARAVLAGLLGEEGKFSHRVDIFRERAEPVVLEEGREPTPEEQARIALLEQQQSAAQVLRKLRAIRDDAAAHEKETGAQVLAVGYPLLSVPAQRAGGAVQANVLAPLCLVPVSVTLLDSAVPEVRIAATGSDQDLVVANDALSAFFMQRFQSAIPEFPDAETEDPLQEITMLVQHAAKTLGVEAPDVSGWPTIDVPSSDTLSGAGAQILPCAVLGMFPMSHFNMLQDLETLGSSVRGNDPLPPAAAPFLRPEVMAVPSEDESAEAGSRVAAGKTDAALAALWQGDDDAFLTLPADPCQRDAVLRSRTARGLVVHGPPGTGKSQTITNIISDHLARGERVLFVSDKRTALDVVKSRLDQVGLSALCAIVHDAARDRMPLFRQIIAEIKALNDTPPPADPARALAAVNRTLTEDLNTIRQYLNALSAEVEQTERNYSQLAARWLCDHAADPARALAVRLHGDLANVPLDDLLEREAQLVAVLDRAQGIGYATSPWRECLGASVTYVVQADPRKLREHLEKMVRAAESLEKLYAAGAMPFPATPGDTRSVAAARAQLGERLRRVLDQADARIVQGLARMDTAELNAVAIQTSQIADAVTTRLSGPEFDAELARTVPHHATPSMTVLLQSASILARAQQSAFGFLGFFRFGLRNATRAVLGPWGQSLTPAGVARSAQFVEMLKTRLLALDVVTALAPMMRLETPNNDAALAQLFGQIHAVAGVLRDLRASQDEVLAARVTDALRPEGDLNALIVTMTDSSAVSSEIETFLGEAQASQLFSKLALTRWGQQLRQGQPPLAATRALFAAYDQLVPLVRLEADMAAFPAPVTESLRTLAAEGLDGRTAANLLLGKRIQQALQTAQGAHPHLLLTDPTRLDECAQRVVSSQQERCQLVRQRIQFQWGHRQRSRLLASTGSRLNGDGAALERRLRLTGRNASRIRQVILRGRAENTDDPLFDMCPVWLCSPDTVATIFPLVEMFDIVIFDEASQCRFEHTLGCVARASRTIIAGDQKQLPPTKFFESATSSAAPAAETADSIETDFLDERVGAEDLLTAAISIGFDETYLDVHYRSRHPDLIAFSNAHFYAGRLQPLPLELPHAARAGAQPQALRFFPVAGTYVERKNEAEARRVVELIRELLARPEPPSLGVVTFNLDQAELILDSLVEAAEADDEFAKQLERAQSLTRDGLFEGLIVKNLENIQGDERDHMILSTTFGPDAEGAFRRNFGPLNLATGFRRLNVVITRAKKSLDLVTSIPESEYLRATAPGSVEDRGGTYLMRYIAFVAQRAQGANQANNESGTPGGAVGTPALAPTRITEIMAQMASNLHGEGSVILDVGSAGLRVDLGIACDDTTSRAVLVDGCGYARASDAAIWEVFRGDTLRRCGWQVRRFWSPHAMVDPAACAEKIAEVAVR